MTKFLTKINESKKGFLTRKKQGDQTILIILGLCVVGVFLLFIFKDSAGDMITNLSNSVNTKIQGIFSGIK